MAWIDNGPVSVPSGAVIAVAAIFVVGAAAVGAGLGFQAGWRDGGHSAVGSAGVADDTAQAIAARPLVELPPPVQAPAPTNTVKLEAATNAAEAANDDDDQAASNEIAVKEAAAQAAQSKPAKPPPDIDAILTSAHEKPEAPAKPSTDEDAPPAPAKTDVPF